MSAAARRAWLLKGNGSNFQCHCNNPARASSRYRSAHVLAGAEPLPAYRYCANALSALLIRLESYQPHLKSVHEESHNGS